MTDPYAALEAANIGLANVLSYRTYSGSRAPGKAEWDSAQRALDLVRAALDARQEPVATLHDDGCFTWKRAEFRRKYDRERVGWRMDVYAEAPPAPQTQRPVRLTEERIDEIGLAFDWRKMPIAAYGRAVEAEVLKINGIGGGDE